MGALVQGTGISIRLRQTGGSLTAGCCPVMTLGSCGATGVVYTTASPSAASKPPNNETNSCGVDYDDWYKANTCLNEKKAMPQDFDSLNKSENIT